jgi:hypothetical protein
MWSIITCSLHLILSGQIKGKKRSGGDDKCIPYISQKGRDCSGDLGINWRIILKWIKERGCDGMG